MFLDMKSSQEYPVNVGVHKGSILGPTLFLLYINDLSEDVICNIAIYADDITLYSKCDQASDLRQQLELASELESDLRDTVGCGTKWLVDFNAGKTQLVLFDWPNNNGAFDVKIDGSGFELTYDLGNTIYFQLSRCKFSHLVKKSQYQSMIQFFIPKQRNITFILLLLKHNFNMHVLREQFYCCCMYSKTMSNKSKLFKETT